VVEALKETIEAEVRTKLSANAELQEVKIISVNGTPVTNQRRLQQGEVLWEAVIVVITTVVTVTDAAGNLLSATANGLPVSVAVGSDAATFVAQQSAQLASVPKLLTYVAEAVTAATTTQAVSGENAFMKTLKATVQAKADAVSDPGVKTTLAQLATAIPEAEAPTATVDQDQVVATTQTVVASPVVEKIVSAVFPEQWYPDWSNPGSRTCLNDDNAPVYMDRVGTYYKATLDACCKTYFNWDYAICAGSAATVPAGFYPNWNTQDSQCLETANSMPNYMRNNPTVWLSPDLETCCEHNYGWDKATCLAKSGGDASTAFIPATPVVPAASPANYVAPLIPPGTPNLGGCPGAWTVNGAYGAGARVAKDTVIYQCKGTPSGRHCPQAGYEPGVLWGRMDFWTFAWDVVGICSDTGGN